MKLKLMNGVGYEYFVEGDGSFIGSFSRIIIYKNLKINELQRF